MSELKLYHYDDVLNLFGIERKTLDRFIKNNEITYRLIGRKKLFTEEDIVEFIDKSKVDAQSQENVKSLSKVVNKARQKRSLTNDRQKESHNT